MELYASAALTGLGYMLHKQRDTLRKSGPGVPEARDKPSMTNVYASDYWTAVRKDEQRRGNEMFTNAKAPFVTGVVPKPAYASMFAADDAQKTFMPGQKTVPSLTGESIPVESFTHNNMQPFFSSKVTQNVDPNANSYLLERFTGRTEMIKPKEETKCFFAPTADMTNVCGMPNNSDFMLEHTVKPYLRNNDFPIDQIRVGPGLGLGYTSQGSGGFHQASTLDFSKEKTVDELRPLSRPKVTLESRAQGPKTAVTMTRGLVGEVAKNRPDTAYEQTPDMWIRTTGANTAQAERPVQVVKPTARVDSHVEYSGHTAAAATQPGQGAAHDYGKSSIQVYNNERQQTETRTVVNNVTSVVKAIMAPFLDILRHTPKDYTLDAAREYGNMSAQIPSKPTLYDPVNHMMRTTIKETTIHDTGVANLKGPESGVVQSDDDAKTTIRETMPIIDTTRNMNGRTYRVIMYNPDAVAKTTVKETTENAVNEAGYTAPFNPEGAYTYIEVKMPHTQKQYISDYEYYGSGESKTDFRAPSHEAYDNAEIDGTREAINLAAGHTPGAGGLYTNTDPDNHHQDTRKAMIDSMAPRAAGNISRVYQTTPAALDGCQVTRPAVNDMLTDNSRRLDPALLNALKSNPFNKSINPLAAD